MLNRPEAFFDALRKGLLGPTLSQEEVDGVNAILAACEGWPICWTAYALATAYHETAHTMQPVRERGSDAYLTRAYDVKGLNPGRARRMGNTQPGDGVRFCGRGYVQLTWRCNYARAEAELGEPFTEKPELAMDVAHAAAVLRLGMSQGWFTGKALRHYLAGERATHAAFKAARRIINGTDCDDVIADYAMAFQAALVSGRWKAVAQAA